MLIGLVGTAANGIVMSALAVANRRAKKSTNRLILNQMSMDGFACALLAVIYSVKLAKSGYRSDDVGDYLLCQFVGSEMLVWIGLNASVAGLVAITAERYARIVHPIAYRMYAREWMIRAAVGSCWAAGVAVNMPLMWLTTGVVDAQCSSRRRFSGALRR